MCQTHGHGPDLFPELVREPFKVLDKEITRLHFRWRLFKQLFGSGQKRVDLLNEAASGFFYQIHFIMLDDVILTVARLLDRSKRTLALPSLIRLVGKTAARDIVPALEADLAKLVGVSEALLRHRDKRIAHADAEHHPELVGAVLPPLTVNLIDEVLKGISDLVNAVQSRFERAQTIHGAVGSLSDADTLVYALRKSADWDHLAKEGVIGRERLLADRYFYA